MKTLLIVFAITYYYQTMGQIFYCKIKYREAGESAIHEHNCLFPKNKGLKDILEEETEDEVILIKVKDIVSGV